MHKNSLKPQSKPRTITGGETKASAQTIDGYIGDQAILMSSARLKELAIFRLNMGAKLTSPQAVERLEFQQLAHLLIKLLGSDEVRLSRDPLPEYLAEAGVAANYLLKGVDLIPDHVPEIGLADDEIILRRVFARNPELNQLLKQL
jgi:Protein of unknown function (DUF1232)